MVHRIAVHLALAQSHAVLLDIKRALEIRQEEARVSRGSWEDVWRLATESLEHALFRCHAVRWQLIELHQASFHFSDAAQQALYSKKPGGRMGMDADFGFFCWNLLLRNLGSLQAEATSARGRARVDFASYYLLCLV
jgi:hypothetical protein